MTLRGALRCPPRCRATAALWCLRVEPASPTHTPASLVTRQPQRTFALSIDSPEMRRGGWLRSAADIDCAGACVAGRDPRCLSLRAGRSSGPARASPTSSSSHYTVSYSERRRIQHRGVRRSWRKPQQPCHVT